METRWLILGGLGSSVPLLFLVVVVFWLTIIFASFGLLAPRNITLVAVFFLAGSRLPAQFSYPGNDAAV